MLQFLQSEFKNIIKLVSSTQVGRSLFQFLMAGYRPLLADVHRCVDVEFQFLIGRLQAGSTISQ